MLQSCSWSGLRFAILRATRHSRKCPCRGLLLSLLLAGVAPLWAGDAAFSNGDFSSGLQDWKITTNSSAKAKSSIESGAYENQNALRIEIELEGAHHYDVALKHGGISLKAGQRYRLQFYCRMEVGVSKLYVFAARNHPPYGEVAKGATFELKDTGWRQCDYTFQSSVTDENISLTIGNLGTGGNVYYFAHFSLIEE